MIPVFKSTYSIGKSILTLDEDEIEGGVDDDAVLGRHQVETEHHRAHGCARCEDESRGVS